MQQQVDTPLEVSGDLRAIVVDATHSPLAAWHDVYMYYRKPEGVRLNAINRLAVLELGGLDAPVVGTIDSAKETVLLLGGVERIEARHLISATRILWMRYT